MSRLFDSMRRAEDERRKRASRSAAPGETEASASAAVETTQQTPPWPGSLPAGTGNVPGGSFRELGMLRNAIEVAFAGKKKKTILFTGAVAGDGTTTIAAAYARMLGLEGRQRVLVCEMNAREPSFANIFSTNGEAGVTEYFLSGDNLSLLIQKCQSDNLDVLRVGCQDATVIQLHLNRMLPKLLEEALRGYDTVVIDAPPVVSSPETPPMTAFVDGVVLVVRAGKTKREAVLRALDSIASFKGRVLGVVLNRKRYYIPGFIYKRI